jgi:hypothetical protein
MKRLLYLVLGLALGFTFSTQYMTKQLDGIITATYELAGASYEKACLDSIGRGNNCHAKAVEYVKELMAITKTD